MDDATANVPQGSGHTIWSRHIDEPKKRFVIEFVSASYVNVLHFADTHRCVFVLAEAPEDALAIARYHHGIRGSNFAVVGKRAGERRSESKIRQSQHTGVPEQNHGGLLPLKACLPHQPR